MAYRKEASREGPKKIIEERQSSMKDFKIVKKIGKVKV